MTTTPTSFVVKLLASFLLLASLAQAQTVGEIIAIKGLKLQQTSAATPHNISATPYFLDVAVDSGTPPITGATYTPPGGSASLLTEDNGEWKTLLNFSDETLLDAAFADGDYTLNVDFTSIADAAGTVNLSGDRFSVDPMITSLTNAAWVGGNIQLTAGTIATINFNAASITGFTDNVDFIGVSSEMNAGGIESRVVVSSFTVGSGQDFDLTTGVHSFELEYVDLSDINTTHFSGAQAFGGYATTLQFNIEVLSAVPEPGSYALWAGALVFFGVISRRRARPIRS